MTNEDADVTKEVTLRQAGGYVSATLPKDMADRLRLETGDRVLADGSLSEDQLTAWVRSHMRRRTRRTSV